MTSRTLLLALSVAAVLPACARPPSPSPSPAASAGTAFTRAQLLEDVGYLFHTIEGVHPDPYFRLDSSAALLARQDLEAAMRDGMGRLEFWRRAAPVVALYRDGHTRLAQPEEDWQKLWTTGAGLFPLILTFDREGAVVRQDLTDIEWIPVGTAVLTINGRRMRGLVREGMATLSYDREAVRLWALNRSQARVFSMVWGWTGPFVVEVELPSAEQQTLTLPGISGVEWTSAMDRGGPRPAPPEPYSFTMLADGRLGYIDFRSHTDPARFGRFLERTFSALRANPPGALVIDLRRNGGGSSELGDQLLGYLTDRPVRQYSRLDVRASPQVKAAHRNRLPRPLRWLPAGVFGLFNSDFGALLGSPDGAVVSWPQVERSAGAQPLRWDGPVYVLIGINTFSAAADLAAALQDYGLATLVGEETGGLASSHGDSYTATLPHTGLQLDVSTKFYVRPSGVAVGGGVVPDMHVPAGPEVALDDDPAIRWILRSLAGAFPRR